MVMGKRLPLTGWTGLPSAKITSPVSAPRSIQKALEAEPLMRRRRTRPLRSVATTSGSSSERSLARKAS